MNNSKKEVLDFNCAPELCSIEVLYSLSVIRQEVSKMLGQTSRVSSAQ